MQEKIVTKDTVDTYKETIEKIFESDIFEKVDIHVVNAYHEDFFYLEFKEPYPKTYLEIIAIYYKAEHKFRNDDIFNPKYLDIEKFKLFFDPPFKPHKSTSNDIFRLKESIDYVLELFKFEKDRLLTIENVDERCKIPRNEILGYYLNNKYRSKIFPQHYIDTILQSDNYITIENFKSSVMILMKKDQKLSLFFHSSCQ